MLHIDAAAPPAGTPRHGSRRFPDLSRTQNHLLRILDLVVVSVGFLDSNAIITTLPLVASPKAVSNPGNARPGGQGRSDSANVSESGWLDRFTAGHP